MAAGRKWVYSDPVDIIVEGPTADLQHHTTGVYRYSALAASQSTAVGTVRCMMGHPGSRIWVQEIHILKIGQYSDGRSGRTSATYQHQESFTFDPSDMESKVTLRRHTILRDVRYLYRVRVYSDDLQTMVKHACMLKDRVRRHKFYQRPPSFGPNEHVLSSWRFPTDADDLTPLDINEDYGFAPFGQDYGDDFGYQPEPVNAPWYVAPYVIKHGIVQFPTWEEVKALGMLRKFEEVA